MKFHKELIAETVASFSQATTNAGQVEPGERKDVLKSLARANEASIFGPNV
jgi:hypothetical protein